MCTVRLEILTEADIVKHVHVHKETESKTAPAAKPSELVGIEMISWRKAFLNCQ